MPSLYYAASIAPRVEPVKGLSAENTTSDGGLTPNGRQLLIAYDVLYTFGFVSLTAVVLTAYFSRFAQRSSLWLVAVFAWAFLAFANILLLGQQTGSQPNRQFCLMQATLIYGTPAFAALTSAVYMVQAYCSICSSLHLNRLSHNKKFIAFLHSIPASVLFLIILEVIIMGQTAKDTIQRDPSGMYCHLTSATPGHITAGITIVGMSTILILEASVFIIIRRSTKTLKDAHKARPESLRLGRNDFSREAFIRMACFSSWALVCIGLSFIVYLPQSIINNTDAQVVQSTLPCVATITFGTQRDVMKAWKFWGKKPRSDQVQQMPEFHHTAPKVERSIGDSMFTDTCTEI